MIRPSSSPACFIVGPSQLHAKFESFIEKAESEVIGSISHRSARFSELHAALLDNLKKLLGVPSDYLLFVAGSATEWMERTVQNCSEKETLNFVNGVFSGKFFEIAQANGRNAVKISPGEDWSFSLETIPPAARPELISLIHNESSSGVMLPRDFVASVRKRFPDAIIALDIVSSAPVSDVDYSLVDCIFFSIQKGFGLPAGLGVMLVGPRALAYAEQVESKGKQYTGSFHSFASLAGYSRQHQTPETPNVLGMYLLNEVCLDFLERGIATMKTEAREKSALIYTTLQNCAKVTPFLKNESVRSQTVIAAEAEGGAKEILEGMKQKGFLISGGYEDKTGKRIRIANFPSHTKEQVAKLCEALREVAG